MVHSNRCSNHNLGSSSWRKIIVITFVTFPIIFASHSFLFLYSVLKVPRATRCEVALQKVLIVLSYSRFTLLCTFWLAVVPSPRLPFPSFDVTCSRFGSGGSPLVGSNGLEPSTSRLSGVRSNHLSYRPLLWSLVFLLITVPFFRRWWR